MSKQIEVLTPESPRWMEFIDKLNRMQACHHDHRRAKQVMTAMGGINIAESIVYFESNGGFCDCEILMNVDPDFWAADTPVGTRH